MKDNYIDKSSQKKEYTINLLLPCPFCGNKPSIFRSPNESYVYCKFVDCPIAFVKFKARVDKMLMKKWNTRILKISG